ncbi:MAG: bifunctional diaminohydroxyphosphoribosylaminopyrimidine deaminase/5-amino-6-(5-phosphoribosylamino)uracil reductase RibD [Bacteroidales bacterium]
MNYNEKYMHRALQLARRGLGSTSPNPLVGCVVVHNDKIIGEGFHRKAGEAHAEVNAINLVKDKELLKQSTLYVTLEPCSHYGRTPPCADLIIESGIPQVVVACTDPNPQVSGRGIDRLRKAGVELVENVCREEAEYLNRRFFSIIKKGRPYVILKWAETPRGFMDGTRKNDDDTPKWLTNEWAKMLVHRQRAEEDAVMVGTNTVLYDNPALTVREWSGTNPVRVLIDRNNRLPAAVKGFNEDGTRVICFCSDNAELPKHVSSESTAGSADMELDILHTLAGQGINSLIIEGGAKFLASFINKGLWDEAFRYIGEVEFDEGTKAPLLSNENLLSVSSVGRTNLYHYIRLPR